MWQQFTENAQATIYVAQEEAKRLGSNSVSSEHILIGLCDQPNSTAVEILGKLGTSIETLKARAHEIIPRKSAQSTQEMSLSPRAKRTIDLAYTESRNLKCNFIGTGHLLLGLIREEPWFARKKLLRGSIGFEEARQEAFKIYTR